MTTYSVKHPFEFSHIELQSHGGGSDIVFVFKAARTIDENNAVLSWEMKEISLADYIDARTR